MIITEFPRYGRLLATHPLKSIGICLLIPALSALGLMKYQTENNPYKLWIPQVQPIPLIQFWSQYFPGLGLLAKP